MNAIEIFFTRQNSLSAYYVSICVVKRTKRLTSYTNLISHIKSAPPEQSKSTVASTFPFIDQFFQALKSRAYCGLLDFIINGLLLFTFVEKCKVRDHVKYKSKSLNKFLRTKKKLEQNVDWKVAALPSEYFALVLNEWTIVNTHHIALFGSFVSNFSCK